MLEHVIYFRTVKTHSPLISACGIHTQEESGPRQVGWIRGIYPTEDTAGAAIEAGEAAALPPHCRNALSIHHRRRQRALLQAERRVDERAIPPFVHRPLRGRRCQCHFVLHQWYARQFSIPRPGGDVGRATAGGRAHGGLPAFGAEIAGTEITHKTLLAGILKSLCRHLTSPHLP